MSKPEDKPWSKLESRHDPDLELAILYSIFSDNSLIETPRASFPIEAFYVERNRRLWLALVKTAKNNNGIITLGLFRQDLMDSDADLLDALVSNVITLGDYEGRYHPLAFPYYITRLLELYADRERHAAAERYRGDIAKGRDEADARIDMNNKLEMLDSVVGRGVSLTLTADDILETSSFPVGFQDADNLTGGFTKPGLNIIAARPSVGKTSMARSIVRSAAKRGERVFWYSIDQSERQVLILEAARLLKVSSRDITSGKVTRDRLQWALDTLRNEEWGGNVVLTDKNVPLGELISMARIAQPDFVVIDYLQIVDAGMDREYDSVTKVSIALKALALDLGIPVLALAQLNRKGADGGAGMQDIRASGQIEQDADQIWMLERSVDDDTLGRVRVVKNKTGPTGSFLLTWLPDRAEYVNHARDSRGY